MVLCHDQAMGKFKRLPASIAKIILIKRGEARSVLMALYGERDRPFECLYKTDIGLSTYSLKWCRFVLFRFGFKFLEALTGQQRKCRRLAIDLQCHGNVARNRGLMGQNTAKSLIILLFLAHPTGFEPVTFGIGTGAHRLQQIDLFAIFFAVR